MTFSAAQGETIRVWMYSPATPGYVVVDDAADVAVLARCRGQLPACAAKCGANRTHDDSRQRDDQDDQCRRDRCRPIRMPASEPDEEYGQGVLADAECRVRERLRRRRHRHARRRL